MLIVLNSILNHCTVISRSCSRDTWTRNWNQKTPKFVAIRYTQESSIRISSKTRQLEGTRPGSRDCSSSLQSRGPFQWFTRVFHQDWRTGVVCMWATVAKVCQVLTPKTRASRRNSSTWRVTWSGSRSSESTLIESVFLCCCCCCDILVESFEMNYPEVLRPFECSMYNTIVAKWYSYLFYMLFYYIFIPMNVLHWNLFDIIYVLYSGENCFICIDDFQYWVLKLE